MHKSMPVGSNMGTDRLKSYSLAFSRRVFVDIIKYNDFKQIDWLYDKYDKCDSKIESYGDYFEYMYNALADYYRCEYVYKNELIGKVLSRYLKQRSITGTVAFNEFKVGNSIADLVLFNGETRAYEIKSDLDSPKRLTKQIYDYKKVFDRCYVVVPETKVCHYLEKTDDETGIIVLSRKKNGSLVLKEARSAVKNPHIDVGLMMKCLHTSEYEHIISNRFGKLPDVPGYMLYDACQELMKTIPEPELKRLFRETVKSRTSNFIRICQLPYQLRQICLSLGLKERDLDILISRMNNKLN